MSKNDRELTCLWCRQVIEPGHEHEHIHVISLPKIQNEQKDKINVDKDTK